MRTVRVAAMFRCPLLAKLKTVTITADVTTTGLVASPTTGPVGTKLLGTVTLGSIGEAMLMISTLTSGVHSITADYAGDTTDKTSKSSVVTVTIT